MTSTVVCLKRRIGLAACIVLLAGNAWTQESNAPQSQPAGAGSGDTNDTNAANNPFELMLTIDLQSRFAPSPNGFPGRDGSQELLRVGVPVDTWGLQQFIRTILPIDTTPSVQGGPNTGVGDLEVYDILPFQVSKYTFGAGPLIAAPTARGEAYDPGKWQAGGVAAVIDLESWGLLSVLATYQHSFSGNSSGPVGGLTTVQPFFFYHFRHGLYFRSSAVMTFDTFHHSQDVPIGFGFGKVWKGRRGEIVNLYVEPQYAVLHNGNGSPVWQVFAGLTIKLPTGKR